MIKRLLIALFLVAAQANASNIYVIRPKSAAAPSYLLDESFEGTGAPSGWSTTGTIDWDEATIVKAGSQSLQIDSTLADGTAVYSFASGTDLYVEFWFYPDHIPSVDATFFRIRNGTTEIGRIRHRTTGVLRVQAMTGSTADMTLSTGEDSWIRIWVHYTQGSGSNGTMRVWWATTDTHPGNGDAQYFAQSTNGTSTLAPDGIQFFSDFAGTTNGSRYWDAVTADDAILW